ncbi:MAG: hypothetical protein AVDCRST_MAG88-2990, partial [uncultured Thermomicrobiales bacterium]
AGLQRPHSRGRSCPCRADDRAYRADAAGTARRVRTTSAARHPGADRPATQRSRRSARQVEQPPLRYGRVHHQRTGL